MSLFSAVLLGGTTIGGPLATVMIAVAGSRAPFALGAGAALIAAVVIARQNRRRCNIDRRLRRTARRSEGSSTDQLARAK